MEQLELAEREPKYTEREADRMAAKFQKQDSELREGNFKQTEQLEYLLKYFKKQHILTGRKAAKLQNQDVD